MSDIQIGELYLVKEFFWFLYPTKELASRAAGRRGRWCRSSASYQDAKVLSEQYKCNVVVVEENTCFVLLEKDEAYYKILDSNGNIGWIVCIDFSKYFELVKAKQ